MSEQKHKHYHKDVSGRQTIDIYGVCEVFEVDDVSGRLHHAIKKILMAGKRGSKGYRQDIQEAVDTLNEKLLALAQKDLEPIVIDRVEPVTDSENRTVRLHNYSSIEMVICGDCKRPHTPAKPCRGEI